MKPDAYFIIKKELSSGPKKPGELRKVCERMGIPQSTFFYHMRQLVEKLREVEEVTEKDDKGRVVKKYALVKEQKPSSRVSWGWGVSGPTSLAVGDIEIGYPPDTRLLELAAWIRHKPSGWGESDDVKTAKLCLEHLSILVPKTGVAYEDPDSYVFEWSSEAMNELRFESLSSRFFDLKQVYDAMTADLKRKVLDVGPVFVGAYCTPIVIGRVGIYGGRMQPLRYVGHPSEYRLVKQPQSVCVAVRKETDANIRVVHVEPREGKLDKAWFSGLAKQLKAKKDRMLGYDSLKEDAKRRLLLNLRNVFEQHGLSISSRYASLIEDLWDYSYRKPSSGYVLALAIAVDLCFN
jgi:hypothetical protein